MSHTFFSNNLYGFAPPRREKEGVGLFALLWAFPFRPTFELQRKL